MSTLEILSAYDQAPMATLPLQSEEEALSHLANAYALYTDKSHWLSVEQRVAILEKAADLIRERRLELALEAAREGGKPLVDSRVEIDRAIDGIKVAIKELTHLHGEEIPMGLNKASEGRMAFTRRVPRGVVLAISAFNHPFNLIVHQAIPAVAAGCPVLVKPASTTPLSCRNLIQILYEAGLPEHWCQMVLCENEVAERLVTDERISFLTFIGSGRVGWYLRSKLPPGATCALEHGGAAPVIVDRTADLDKAIPLLTKGGYYHAGQVCVSVQRIFAHKEIADALCDGLQQAVQGLRVGDPTLEETDVGPLILPREVDRVDRWVRNAVTGGATLLCGGRKLSDTSYAPTLLRDVAADTELMTQEVFGPVVCVNSYDSLDEAIEQANGVEFAFQAAVFTNDLQVMLGAISDLEGLAVMVNDHTAFRVDWMPFGGYKQSGLGVGGIGHTLRDMTLEKMFVIKQ